MIHTNKQNAAGDGRLLEDFPIPFFISASPFLKKDSGDINIDVRDGAKLED